jgi:hypothetical protein
LQSWFLKNLAGGDLIRIATIDNPGWSIKIDLTQSDAPTNPQLLQKGDSEEDSNWIYAEIKDGHFYSAAGSLQLTEMIEVLHAWVDPHCPLDSSQPSSSLRWLEEWYTNQCNGDWEHYLNCRITAKDGGWSVRLRISDTELEDRPFPDLAVNRSDSDWFSCTLDGEYFTAVCGPQNLEDVLRAFMTWGQQDH